jgi:hypothetical protein
MNSFMPPKNTIKQFNPIEQEKQMIDLRRATAPNRPNQVMPVQQTSNVNPQMSAFAKLRAMLGGK